MEVIDMKENKETTAQEQRNVVMEHAKSPGWWDGPDEYSRVNRNVVSACQRDSLFSIVESLCSNDSSVGLGIGGVGRARNAVEVNVNPSSNPGIFADGRYLPFKNESIAWIISSHTLEHIPDTLKTLTEWVRVLRKNGLIAITIPDRRFFLHDNDNPNHKYYDLAPSEMDEKEFQDIVNQLEDVEVLRFGTNKNNFDIDCLLRKR